MWNVPYFIVITGAENEKNMKYKITIIAKY